MKKKFLVFGCAALMCLSMTACSFGKLTPAEPKEPTTEEEVEEGFKSSEDVITAYWQAFADVKKSGFRECFPDPDKAKRGETNIDDQVASSYETAKEVEDSVEIDVDGIDIDEDNFDVDDVENDLGKAYDIEKAKISTVTVPMKQTVDGQTYDVEDIYEIVTVKIDGNWYISTINEIDVNIVSDPTSDPTTEDPNVTVITPTEEPTEDPIEEEPTTTVDNPVSVSETDYSKVNWGVTYPIDGYEGVTISVTPYVDDYSTYYLVVGVTNVYDKQITLSATASAKDSSGAYIGDTFAYVEVGPGNTNLFTIRCDEGTTPNGEIHWEDLKISESYKEYVPWTADWTIDSESANELTLKYTVTTNQTATVGQVYGLLLDSKGFVIDVFSDYVSDPGTSITDEDSMYRTGVVNSDATDVALFINPTK